MLVESCYKPSKHVVILTHDNPNNSTIDITLLKHKIMDL